MRYKLSLCYQQGGLLIIREALVVVAKPFPFHIIEIRTFHFHRVLVPPYAPPSALHAVRPDSAKQPGLTSSICP